MALLVQGLDLTPRAVADYVRTGKALGLWTVELNRGPFPGAITVLPTETDEEIPMEA